MMSYGVKPKCRKCNRPAQLYGGIGGYSVCCKVHNKQNAARQRVQRARHKLESA